MQEPRQLKVALVHDFLVEYGGGERVLECLHEIFPDAPIYTAYFDINGFGVHQERVKKWDIRSSWLQRLPFAKKLISPLRVFAPMVFEGFDLSGYDLVISSCNSYFAKAVITRPGSLHISYIHTPPRYLYGYATSFNYKKHLLTRVLGELANHFLRIYDFETSQRPDVLVANSKNVADRINKFYRRNAVIIYPPVEVGEIKAKAEKLKVKNREYLLSLNRLVRGKGTEVTVEVCTKLNLSLKVVGNGPEKKRLKKIAGEKVQFLGEVDDDTRIKLLAGAKALIVASEDEDFGITAVEAMAAGTPVIAIGTGGYKETVVEGKTGVFFAPYKSVKNLMNVLPFFNEFKFKKEDLVKQAEKFSKQRFVKEILALVDKNLKR
ncbi:glycosyltransferase [Candidatus Daviesbacteria bacterium]|nr:glycosyltransferase [Candidatus Daviesbacteria bacterium]